MAEPVFNAGRGDGGNQDDVLVMGVPGTWMAVLHPGYRSVCTEDVRRPLGEGCSILSAPAPGACRKSQFFSAPRSAWHRSGSVYTVPRHLNSIVPHIVVRSGICS